MSSKSWLVVVIGLSASLACSGSKVDQGSNQSTSSPACAGVVNVTQGLLAGGGPGEAMAASAFYSFGPRVILTGPGCGSSPGSGSIEGNGLIFLNLAAGIAPGTYQLANDGGDAFQVQYAFTSTYYGGYVTSPVSGTLTLTAVNPSQGVQGHYDFDFGGSGVGGGHSLPDGGFVFGSLGELIERGTFVAPICDLCGLGETEDAGAAGLDDAGLSACAHLYAAQYQRCGGPVLPAGETSRLLIRFEQVCANQIALPGSCVTAASLEACASALEVSPCDLPAGMPAACDPYGSRAGGEACGDDIQCRSESCAVSLEFTPEGPIGEERCGTCEDAGGASPACGALPGTCAPGSYPSGQSAACEPLAGAGDSCARMSCAPPLACNRTSGICVSNADGGVCEGDQDCGPGLGCVPAYNSSSGQCLPITWAQAGEPCTDAVRCLVGSCDFPGFFSLTVDPDGGLVSGICPAVIPDGQFCTIAPGDGPTCDTFSECFEGACVLTDTASCQ